jgi:hypothetical protein
MGASVTEFSGRVFTPEEIELIEYTCKSYPKLSRRELASTVCELIGWLTPGGMPKTPQCARLLKKLEGEAGLELPALSKTGGAGRRAAAPPAEAPGAGGAGEAMECGGVELEVVRPGARLRQWRAYVSRHHPLGDPPAAGSQIRYMVTSGGRDAGCMLFAGAALSLEARERWIGWTREQKAARLHLVVNQQRFLVLPWAHARNLASRALSQAERRLQADWLGMYGYAPALVETFVDTSFYRGTIYKAANWALIGETKGRGRNDRRTERALTRKAIYVRPLQRDFREVLLGRKPWKAAGLDG